MVSLNNQALGIHILTYLMTYIFHCGHNYIAINHSIMHGLLHAFFVGPNVLTHVKIQVDRCHAEVHSEIMLEIPRQCCTEFGDE